MKGSSRGLLVSLYCSWYMEAFFRVVKPRSSGLIILSIGFRRSVRGQAAVSSVASLLPRGHVKLLCGLLYIPAIPFMTCLYARPRLMHK